MMKTRRSKAAWKGLERMHTLVFDQYTHTHVITGTDAPQSGGPPPEAFNTGWPALPAGQRQTMPVKQADPTQEQLIAGLSVRAPHTFKSRMFSDDNLTNCEATLDTVRVAHTHGNDNAIAHGLVHDNALDSQAQAYSQVWRDTQADRQAENQERQAKRIAAWQVRIAATGEKGTRKGQAIVYEQIRATALATATETVRQQLETVPLYLVVKNTSHWSEAQATAIHGASIRQNKKMLRKAGFAQDRQARRTEQQAEMAEYHATQAVYEYAAHVAATDAQAYSDVTLPNVTHTRTLDSLVAGYYLGQIQRAESEAS